MLFVEATLSAVSKLVTDPVKANYIIAGVVVVFLVVLCLKASPSFLHFGPGTNASNTASFLGMKIDNWGTWSLMMGISILYSFLVHWNKSIVSNFAVQQFKSVKVSFKEVCREMGSSGGNMCKTAANAFAIVDGFSQAILAILPILIFTTKQLQFLIPAIVIGTILTWLGAMRYFRKKEGYPNKSA